MDREYTGSPDRQTPESGGAQPTRNKKKETSAGRVIGKIIGWIFLTLFTLCVIGVATAAIFFRIFMTYVDTTLIPSLGEISYEEMTMSLASTIYAQDSSGSWIPIQTLFDNNPDTGGGNRELIEYDDVPDHLIKALVAIEDHRFWDHHGVDWYGTLGAIKSTLTGGATRGGSTITQQVLRNMTNDDEVTVKRKFREIFRALEFEKTTNKEDILTEYLNRVYFGAGCYGIQTAAKTYFGKDVSELDLAESAAIVGITNNPSLYDPFRDVTFDSGKTPRDFNKQRQEVILDRMLELEIIDEATCEAAKAEKLLFTDTPEYKALYGEPAPEPAEGEAESGEAEEAVDTSKIYTWFVDAVIDDAAELVAEARGVSREDAIRLIYRAGYHIYTTVDLDLQAIVDEVYQDPSNFDHPSKTGAPMDSAMTIVDPYTGDVKAMAGGVGVKTVNRGLNLATVRRQPGSAIKPVAVYAPAIDKNIITPITVFDDYPIRLNDSGTGGFPKNSPMRYRGPVTVTTGLQYSINTVAVRIMEKMGYSTSFEFMENNLGFDLDPNDIALSPLSMGGLTQGVTTEEMAAAYGSFVNQGVYNKPRTITRIESNDHTEVIVDNSVQSTVAMKESTAYLMNKLLRNVLINGNGSEGSFSGMTLAGKTGTTNDNKDRYFAGYSGYYSAAVWVGYAEKPEQITARGNPAAVIWKKVMERIHEGLEDKPFPERPEGITSYTVCADCGLRPCELCGSRLVSAEIQAGTAPTEICTCHVEARICTDPETGERYIAGEYCPEDTVTTEVMLKGRTYLGIPDGSGVEGAFSSIIHAEDDERHLTYLATKGPCPLHDENFVPEPGLPGEEEGEPLPGDPGYQFPIGPWDEDSVLPNQPSQPDTDPGNGDPSAPPEEPPVTAPNPSDNQTAEPPAPEEPDLPAEPDLP